MLMNELNFSSGAIRCRWGGAGEQRSGHGRSCSVVGWCHPLLLLRLIVFLVVIVFATSNSRSSSSSTGGWCSGIIIAFTRRVVIRSSIVWSIIRLTWGSVRILLTAFFFDSVMIAATVTTSPRSSALSWTFDPVSRRRCEIVRIAFTKFICLHAREREKERKSIQSSQQTLHSITNSWK